MLTIFAVPKPFEGHIGLIQRNAIKSWLRLEPKPEIILFFEERGTEEIAREFGLKHIKEVRRNEFGTPFLSDVYDMAQKTAGNRLVAYVNSDIILLQDFIESIKRIKMPDFMMTGRRWNLDIKEEINFDDSAWEEKLRALLKENGELYRPSALDYSLFPKSFNLNLPPFTVGRSGGSDNWQLYRAKCLKLPIIDATESTTVVHQNHEAPSHDFKGKKGEEKKIEMKRNVGLADKFYHAYTLRDADFILTKQGLARNKINPFLRFCLRYSAGLKTFYPFFDLPGKIVYFPVFLLVKTLFFIRNLINEFKNH